MESTTVRAVNAADWPRIGELGTLLIEAHHAFDAARFIPSEKLPGDVYVAHLQKEMEKGHTAIFVADVGGRVMGYIYASIRPESWKELRHEAGYIHDVVVDPAAQRTGLGTALLERATQWIEERGVRRAMLWSAPPNLMAHALFKRLGFRPTMIEFTRDLE